MLLPYAAYLRVYELAELETGALEPPIEAAGTITLAREQQTMLLKTLAWSAPEAHDDLAGCYVMRRDGRLYVCAVDLALRSWMALATFVEDTDSATRGLFLRRDHAERAEVQLASWRQTNPSSVPHIKSATWGVPRSWFLLVDEAEREWYAAWGTPSIRFRTRLADARSRLAAARTIIDALIDDEDLSDELDDLQVWLDAFHADSWVELDYAGVAQLLGGRLDTDTSATEISAALDALGRKDFASAGEAYRAFVDRWRVVNALERAN